MSEAANLPDWQISIRCTGHRQELTRQALWLSLALLYCSVDDTRLVIVFYGTRCLFKQSWHLPLEPMMLILCTVACCQFEIVRTCWTILLLNNAAIVYVATHWSYTGCSEDSSCWYLMTFLSAVCTDMDGTISMYLRRRMNVRRKFRALGAHLLLSMRSSAVRCPRARACWDVRPCRIYGIQLSSGNLWMLGHEMLLIKHKKSPILCILLC